MPHGFRCAKKTLLGKRQRKTSVPQLHTGMRCGSGGFACQPRDPLTSTRPQVTEPRPSRATRASGRPWSVALTHRFLRPGRKLDETAPQPLEHGDQVTLFGGGQRVQGARARFRHR